jgi:hypothetical protein
MERNAVGEREGRGAVGGRYRGVESGVGNGEGGSGRAVHWSGADQGGMEGGVGGGGVCVEAVEAVECVLCYNAWFSHARGDYGSRTGRASQPAC